MLNNDAGLNLDQPVNIFYRSLFPIHLKARETPKIFFTSGEMSVDPDVKYPFIPIDSEEITFASISSMKKHSSGISEYFSRKTFKYPWSRF